MAQSDPGSIPRVSKIFSETLMLLGFVGSAAWKSGQRLENVDLVAT